MALIDKASLLMVPSTYEAGKLYNVLPSGNRAPDSTDQNSGYDQTRADFTFDRGSNASATRIGSDGLIKKYRENFLVQSNQFDTTWTNSGTITRTSGQSGYDGSNDAWLLTKGSVGAFIRQTNSQSGVRTFSVYAKADTSDWLLLDIDGSPDAFQYFDLANGVLGATGTNVDATITSVGGSWYRCSVTGADTYTEVRIYPAEGNNDVSATTGNIYIQSAQLEKSLVATDVLTSGATTAKAGVLVDTPRINYDANGQNGSLILEPQRTNLWNHSEYVSGNPLVSSPIITENYAVSPEGLSNAFRIQDTTSGSFKRISISSSGLSVSPNSTYTQSLFVKKATSPITNYGGIGFDYTGGTTRKIAYVVFDEYNGTLAELTSSFPLNTTLHPVEDYGDYWRFSVSTTDNGNNTNLSMNIYACLSTNGTSAGTGTKDWTGYGIQLEAGNYATSYIPCTGTSETRAADSCSVTGASDVIGQTEGTLFVEAETLENGADCRITISDNTINNRVSIEWDANADTIKGFIGVGGNLETTSYDQTNRNKIAIVYNSSDARLFINGTKLQTDTSVPSLSGMDRIEFSNYGAALPFVGKVYKMYISEEKLTDAEAITLTTL